MLGCFRPSQNTQMEPACSWIRVQGTTNSWGIRSPLKMYLWVFPRPKPIHWVHFIRGLHGWKQPTPYSILYPQKKGAKMVQNSYESTFWDYITEMLGWIDIQKVQWITDVGSLKKSNDWMSHWRGLQQSCNSFPTQYLEAYRIWVPHTEYLMAYSVPYVLSKNQEVLIQPTINCSQPPHAHNSFPW